MRMLAIETSCDETAAAVIGDGPTILSDVVASQIDLHRRFGGVVPEVACRAHLDAILPTIEQALAEAGVAVGDLTAVAVVHTPGLVGALLVGVTVAKTLALALGVPLVAVNHLQAHIYACQLCADEPVYPCVALIVSGGHSSLFWCAGALDLEVLGSTTDDAAGEAFDKVAAILGLGYPGGPAIQKAAADGDPKAYAFPRSYLAPDSLDFSFSGLKTAVLYTVHGKNAKPSAPIHLPAQQVADVAASFQEAVVDVLVDKTVAAARQRGARHVCVGGGVAANACLRERLAQGCEANGLRLFLPTLRMSTDNAAMCAIALEQLRAGQTAPLDLDAAPQFVRRR
jgi:tRNA N6-adenosine threonylcarbamoyltransferase